MRTLPYVSSFGGVSAPPAIELAEKIVELAPPGLSAVFFVSGGSEANETAIKLARRHWVRDGEPEKSIVLAHDRGYHGLAGVTTTATRLQPYHGDFGIEAPDRGPSPLRLPLRRRHPLGARDLPGLQRRGARAADLGAGCRADRRDHRRAGLRLRRRDRAAARLPAAPAGDLRSPPGAADRRRELSGVMAALLAPLRDHPEVGEVRQAGLMVGVELVADRATRERWPAAATRGRRAAAEARGRGLLTRSLLDDVLCLAPPFTISEAMMGRAVEILAESIEATRDLQRPPQQAAIPGTFPPAS
jgi:adenosylmethionine-8-amino-7-oxononanoate aminotransferase